MKIDKVLSNFLFNHLMSSDPNSDQIRQKVVEKITRWLSEEGRFIQHTQKTGFHYFGSIPIPATEAHDEDVFHVSIPNSSNDQIWVEKESGFSRVDRTTFSNLSNHEQNRFLSSLKKELHSANVEFTISEDITTVHFKKILYFDGLSKTSLFNAISSIFSASGVGSIVYSEYSDKLNRR